MNFVHLKTQSHYSITEGLNQVDDLVGKASEDGMFALALTDKNGMFGSVEFCKACQKKGVKPIIGLDVTIESADGVEYQMTLLAKNLEGYKSLMRLNSIEYTVDRKPKVSLKSQHLKDLKGCVVLSGGKHGLIGKRILEGRNSDALLVATQMKKFFGEDFYIELQRDGMPDEEKYMRGAVEVCQKLGIAPVATHPVLFMTPGDFVAHETRFCIGAQDHLFSMDRPRPFNKEMYFKTQKEMEYLFSDIPQALENTVEIAKKCNVKMELGKPMLPHYPTPEGVSASEFFAQKAREGLEQRLVEDFNEKERIEVASKYRKRLEDEIAVIQKMDFPGYFLIVSDFINWAKSKDIPVGPGRGSGAGSLVAYSMRITDLDPLPYNLLFERFLNPERVSMPDFDIDFCQDRRPEVYEYVRDKYGENAVAKIGTFGTIAAKSSIRDVGRALGYSYNFVENLSKLVNIQPAHPMKLKHFIFGKKKENGEWEIEPDQAMLDRYNNEADVKKLVDIAVRVEGVTRQLGTHAAGVVIAPSRLDDFTPLYTVDEDATPSTQFEMGDVEAVGLVKFDFLGLRNLTIIKETVDLVNERNRKIGLADLSLKEVNLNDPEIFKNVFINGNTAGIFQFEGEGITNTIKAFEPHSFNDLIAINALYRPGPMDIIPDCIASKNSPEDQRVYPHPLLKDVLKETYGYMIYQEQVMQCAQVIAGYSLGEADILRRAMGKKKPEEMAAQRVKFLEGAAKNGVDEKKANEIFDLMEKFAGYGFNKSHAAAYSYVAFQTAFLKHYYKHEFFVANLNSNITPLNAEKIYDVYSDAKRNGLEILGPDVNESMEEFSVQSNGKIRYALGGIKGVGEKGARAIQSDRKKNGPFLSFYDFLERVGGGGVNKRVAEALIKAGAFDSIHPNRAELFENLVEGLDYVSKLRKKKAKTVSVLGDAITNPKTTKIKRKTTKVEEPLVRPEMKPHEEWSPSDKARNEKSVMGYYFSFNPYNSYFLKELGGLPSAMKLAQVQEKYEEEFLDKAFIAGIVEDVSMFKSKKGAFVKISDGEESHDVIVFSSILDENKAWLKKDAFVSMKVKVSPDERSDAIKLIADQVFDFEKTKQMTMSRIKVAIQSANEIDDFKAICEKHIAARGQPGTFVNLFEADGRGGFKTNSLSYKVIASNEFMSAMRERFGEEWVKADFHQTVDKIYFPEYSKKNKGNWRKSSAFVS